MSIILRLTTLALLVCLAGLTDAVPANTRIENQATASFHNTVNGADEQVSSATVTAVVQAVRAINLIHSYEKYVLPASTSIFLHTLINEGNQSESVVLSLNNSNSSGPSTANIALWNDTNKNGVVDDADTNLALESTLTLLANEERQLIVVATLSSNAQNNDEIQLALTATGQGNTVFVRDQLTVKTTTEVNVVAQPRVSTVASQSEVPMKTSIALSGAAPLLGSSILVNGQLQSLVVISTPLPSGVFLSRELTAPEGYIALYRIAGTPAGSYTTVPPDDLHGVAEIAFATAEISVGEEPAFEYFLEMLGEPREVTMWSSIRHSNAEVRGIPVPIQLTADQDGEGDSKALLVNNGVSTEESPMVLRTDNNMDVKFTCYSCDLNPDSSDLITIEIVSQNTGDIELVTLTETDFRSGTFSSSALWLSKVSDNPISSNDGNLAVTKNDWITVKVVSSDGRVFEQKLLIDPAGYVFDSVTGNTIANAEVTLYRINEDGSLSLAEVFADLAGTIRSPNPAVTDPEGYYEFPFVAPGNYQLSVTRLPSGFAFPSLNSGEDMGEISDFYANFWGYDATGELTQGQQVTIADGPSYGNTFEVVSQAVFIDIPVDPDYLFSGDDESRGIALNISTDRREAEIGEAIGYTVDIANHSGNQLQQIEIRLDAPIGFQYLPNSAIWDGESLADPVVTNGELVFLIDTIESEAESTLNFRVVVTPAALGGNGISVARATGLGPDLQQLGAANFYSRKARVKITVNRGVFHDDGIITGKIFHDCNGDGLQNNEEGTEAGISGVRFYLQNGRYVETDAFGRYSFSGLRPAIYLVKADTYKSNITDWTLSYTNNHNRRGDLLRVNLTSGELYRADFPLKSCSIRKSYSIPEENENVETDTSTNNNTAKNSSNISFNQSETVGSSHIGDPIYADISLTEKESRSLITFPQHKSRITNGQTTLNLEGPLSVTFEVAVNGKLLSKDRLGKQTTDTAAGIQTLSYYAVNLLPGRNTILAVARDRWGNERARDEIYVVRPGEIRQITWTTQPNNKLLADNSLQTIALSLLDEHDEKIAGDVPVTINIVDGLTSGLELIDLDLDALTPGTQMLAVDGELSIGLRSPSRTGPVTLQAAAGSLLKDLTLNFVPKQRDWIIVGLAESEYSEIESEGRGRFALFAKGTVKDDYLVTLIADTDKQNEDDWAGRPDLERDYLIYGDDAVSGSEGESDKGLYLRIEHDESFALIGDFRPDQDNRRTRVGAYNRKLYGLQQHYEGEKWQFETFMARTSSAQVVDYIRARGTSGPFSLSKYPMTVNSESVEVVTRTRAPDGEIVETERLVPFVDYEIDPVLGTLFLRSPLSGTDDEGRPRYLRVSYNLEDADKNETDTIGADINYAVSDNLTLGVRAVIERGDINDYSLSSVNGAYQINASTALAFEYAQSINSGLDLNNRGNAISSRLEHNSKDRQVRLNVNDSSRDFDNISAATSAGTQSAEFRWQENISEIQNLWLGVRDFSNHESNVQSRTNEIGTTIKLYENVKVGVSLEQSKSETPLGMSFEDTSLGTQLQYRPDWLKAASLEARAYQALDTDRQRQTLTMDYQLPNSGNIVLSWQHFQGYDVNGDLNERAQSRYNWTAGYRQQVHSTTEIYSEYRLRDAADGVENSTATGMRFGYDIKKGLRLIAQAERTLDLADNPQTPSRYSWSLGLSGFEADESKWLAKIEMLAADDKRWLQEIRWAKRFNEEWSMLARERLQWRNSIGDYAAKVTAGLAYRPVRNNTWDWLGSLGFERGQANIQNSLPEISRSSLRNTINYRPHQKWTFTGGLVVQHTKDLSEYSYSSLAWLARARAYYDVSEKWSLGVLGSYFTDERFSSSSNSWGAELQRSLGDQFFIGLRYQNFTYEDEGIDPDSVYRRGVSFQFGGTFDERSLAGLLRRLD